MSTSKQTWHLVKVTRGVAEMYLIESSEGVAIAHVYEVRPNDTILNGHLIAAAPNLLKFVKEVAKFLSPRSAKLDLARGSEAHAWSREAAKLAAKAEGQ